MACFGNSEVLFLKLMCLSLHETILCLSDNIVHTLVLWTNRANFHHNHFTCFQNIVFASMVMEEWTDGRTDGRTDERTMEGRANEITG